LICFISTKETLHYIYIYIYIYNIMYICRYIAVLSEDTIVDSDAIAVDFGKQVNTTVFGGALAILVVSTRERKKERGKEIKNYIYMICCVVFTLVVA
jgi:hypothetical protein